MRMNFQFAVPSKNVDPINPRGTVAVCTLWTPPEFVRRRLEESGADLSSASSPVAVVGGLYGGGLKIMLRNLLNNPQIDTVAVVGKDHAGAGGHLVHFFQGDVRRTGRTQQYLFDDGHVEEREKVEIFGSDSTYTMDDLVLPEMFRRAPRIEDFFSRPLDDGIAALAAFLRSYVPGSGADEGMRLAVPLPTPEVSAFPGDRGGHVIAADTILEAWEKVLYRLARFGRPVEFRNGKKRNELLNLKVVVREPEKYTDADLLRFNLPPEEIAAYQEELLCGDPGKDGVAYTYGNRMRSYFGRDLPAAVAKDLALERDSRHGFLTLWDNTRDIDGGKAPCLATLFFRKIDDAVHLTAVFRSHNGTRAWPRNCLGLLGVLRFVCDSANALPGKTEPHHLRPGTLNIISLSISIDTGDLDQVKGYVDDYAGRNAPLVLDPYGYLRVAIAPAEKEIVVQQYDHENELLAEYRGTNPADVSRQLYRLEALSDISHALYLGGQLEKAYFCLVHGLEYVQDKTVIRCSGGSPVVEQE